MTDDVVRALSPEDVAEARELVSRRYEGTRYGARFREILDDAARGGEDECLLLARASSLAGLALLSAVAGANGTAKVHLIAGVDAPACAGLAAAIKRRDDRLVIAEVPDEEIFAPMILSLASAGFMDEGRVPDWIADGIALRILVSRRTGAP
jgi:hypothetical protein